MISNSHQLRMHDQDRPNFYEVLLTMVQDSDEYSTLMRVVGLYPIASLPVAIVSHRVFEEIAAWHKSPPDSLQLRGTLVAYGPAGGSDFSQQEVRKILERSRQNPLGIPLPAAAYQKSLLAVFAPVIIQDIAGDYDKPGKMVWRDTGVEIDFSQPRMYTYFTHAYFNNSPVLQLNYVLWYSARNGQNAPLIERGHLDGLTIRISLGNNGRPFMVDIMNNCGCYHFFVPRKDMVRRVLPSPLATDAFVPAWLPSGFPERRLTIRVVSGWHQVANVDAREIPVGFKPYDMVSYDQLEMLPKNGVNHESLFTARGIGKYSERVESDIFIPMGIPLVGQMRQRGHHAIKFVGRAHFDDPWLFDQHFEFK
jgi:hypothetical protein